MQPKKITPSPIEEILAHALKARGVTFKREVDIDMFRVDFTVDAPDGRKIIIEADGKRWHQNKAKDAFRQEYLESLGYEFMRFKGSTITRNPEFCAREIKREIQALNYIEVRVYADGSSDQSVHAESDEAQKSLEALKVAISVG